MRLLITALLGATLSAPAAAHTELIASTPAADSSLAAAPAQLELTFDETVTLPSNAIEVIGPDNVTWEIGTPTVSGPVVRAPVTANGPAGRYTLVYRVVSSDGDPVSGSVGFTLTAPASAAATTATPTATASATRSTPTASGGGTLLWVWLAAGAVLLAAVAFVTLRVRRPRR
jgi:copper resistance protein C